jgi:hypothetical protein
METKTSATKALENKNIEITLCIGLYGVCVISIVGDEYEIVSSDIESQGPGDWYENLPEHSRPMQGIYTLNCDLVVKAYSFTYKILTADTA